MAKDAEAQVGNLLKILAKLSPDVLGGLASTVAGGLEGGLLALVYTSYTASAPAVATGAGAYAVGAGATAVTLNGGIAIAIGAGASASAVRGIAVAIAPAVALGIGVGALIGILTYLVSKYYALSTEKGKQD